MVILCAILVPDDGHIAMNKADKFLEFAASLARWLLGTNSKKKKKNGACHEGGIKEVDYAMAVVFQNFCVL